MSTEKIIKKQAKNSLVGNWSLIICALLVLCAVAILLNSIFYFIISNFKLVDIKTGVVFSQRKFIYNLVTVIITATAIFVSPLINGVLKMSGEVALNSRTEIFTLFYFFRSFKRYVKTLCLNIVLAVLCAVLLYGLDVYALISHLLKADLHSDAGFDIITLALFAAYTVTIVIRILIYLIFVHYPLMTYSLDDSKNVLKYLFGYIGFAIKNLGNSIKLLISFAGWIVVCFFVVPTFYVLPYLMTSATISAKWLLIIDENFQCDNIG